MPHYETVIVLRQDLSNAQAQEIAEKTKKELLKADAKISRAENWGLRTLSYPIRKNKKGHYFLINHSNSSKITQEMERLLRLNEDLLRLLTIKTETPIQEPSPISAQEQNPTQHEARSDRGYQARSDRPYQARSDRPYQARNDTPELKQPAEKQSDEQSSEQSQEDQQSDEQSSEQSQEDQQSDEQSQEDQQK